MGKSDVNTPVGYWGSRFVTAMLCVKDPNENYKLSIIIQIYKMVHHNCKKWVDLVLKTIKIKYAQLFFMCISYSCKWR